jgi:hypothetical protein
VRRQPCFIDLSSLVLCSRCWRPGEGVLLRSRHSHGQHVLFRVRRLSVGVCPFLLLSDSLAFLCHLLQGVCSVQSKSQFSRGGPSSFCDCRCIVFFHLLPSAWSARSVHRVVSSRLLESYLAFGSSAKSTRHFLCIVACSPPPHVAGDLLKGSCTQSLPRLLHTLLQGTNLELSSFDKGGYVEFPRGRNRWARALHGDGPGILNFLSLSRVR